jgi:hypothetical protein
MSKFKLLRLNVHPVRGFVAEDGEPPIKRKVKVFLFRGLPLRTYVDWLGKPWFFAEDIARGLGLADKDISELHWAWKETLRKEDFDEAARLLKREKKVELWTTFHLPISKLPCLLSDENRHIAISEMAVAYLTEGLTEELAPRSHIYVIGEKDGPYKIGIADNTENRLSSLQTSNPRKLEVFLSVDVDKRAARDAERIAHAHVAKTAIRGEWFSCPLEIAIESVHKARAEAIFLRRRAA